MDMKSIGIFLAGAVVAGLLVWGFLAMQPAETPEVADTTDTTQTDTTGGTNNTGTAVTPGNPVAQNGHFLYTVTYNNDFFTPAVLNIKQGDSVKFVNNDNLTMRVSVSLHNSTSTSGNVMDSKSVGKGGTYSFTFTTKGVWLVQNINEAGNIGGGAINVR